MAAASVSTSFTLGRRSIVGCSVRQYVVHARTELHGVTDWSIEEPQSRGVGENVRIFLAHGVR